MHIGGAKRIVCPHKPPLPSSRPISRADSEHRRALGFRRFFRRAVFHHLDAEHQTLAAHVADDFVFRLQLFQPGEDARAFLSEFSCNFSFSMTSSTALPIALTTGFPPNVLK